MEDVGEFMKYTFSDRAQNIGASLIRQMFNYAARDVQGYVSLGVGVPSFRLPEHVRTQLSNDIENDPNINKYVLGRGLPALNKAVAQKLERKGIYVNPERGILTTAGSAGGIFCTLMTVIDNGDEVIVPSPAYSNHVEVIRFAGGNPVYIPLLETAGWRLDLNAIERAITERTKAIVLCNPSNPTGALFAEADLRTVGELARKRNLLVLEDDAYEFLTYDGNQHFSLASVPGLKDNVIAFFTPSKEYAMTGFRAGWVIANNAIIDKVFDVQDQNYICAPSISQYAALAALTGPQDNVEQFRRELSRRRDIICERLERLPIFDYQKPQGAYYVFPRLSQGFLERRSSLNGKASERLKEIPERFRTKDTKLALELLYDAGVVTVPGISFGPQGENHLRFSFAAEERDIQEAFDRIERWLEGI